MSLTVIICNLLPALAIIYFIRDGWRKGALYMFLSLVRLIVTYFLARILSSLLVQALLSVTFIKTQFSQIAEQQIHLLNQLPGLPLLLTGTAAQMTVESVTWWLLYGVCYLLIFIALMIFFSAILKMSRALNNVVIIGWINRLLGAAEGLVFGTGLTLILVYLIAYLCSVLGFANVSHSLLNSWLPVLFLQLIHG